MSAEVRVRSAVKTYDGIRVLDGIDLTVHGGHETVVLGPSGSGKSTLLRTITIWNALTAATSASTANSSACACTATGSRS